MPDLMTRLDNSSMSVYMLYGNDSRFTFNFSITQANDVLNEHFAMDRIFDYGTETVIITFYVLLMVMGLFCNLFVSMVVLTNVKIRSSRNVLVINLNLSDILLCVFCMPFTLLVLIRRSWVLGTFLCKTVPFVQAATIFVSSATVLAIALDRYHTIINFNPQNPRRGKREMTISTVIIWMTAFLLSTPYCVFQGTVPVGLPGLNLYFKCAEVWPNADYKSFYTVMTLVVQFVIPAIVLLVTHVLIRSHLNARILRVGDDSVEQVSQERLKRDLKRNTRATMVLFTISVVFSVSWLPWNGLNLLVDHVPNLMQPKNLYLAFAFCHMAAMSSSVTNPILYGWLNNNIRREMVRVGWMVVKTGSALVSNRSSSDNQGLQQNTFIRSSGESVCNRNHVNPESQL